MSKTKILFNIICQPNILIFVSSLLNKIDFLRKYQLHFKINSTASTILGARVETFFYFLIKFNQAIETSYIVCFQ